MAHAFNSCRAVPSTMSSSTDTTALFAKNEDVEHRTSSRRALFQTAAAATFSAVMAGRPLRADAAADCFSDCLKNCKLIAPKVSALLTSVFPLNTDEFTLLFAFN
jgi:hypothetical protein